MWLVGSSECCPRVSGAAKECPVKVRDARSTRLSGLDNNGAKDGGECDWLFFFGENLQNIIFGQLVGVGLISGLVIVGGDGDAVTVPPKENE